MIREGGLYTLLGSKPLTEFDVQSVAEETEEELQTSYENLKAFLDKAEKEKNSSEEERTAFNHDGMVLPTYEKYKERWEKNRTVMKALNSKKLWEKWKNLEESLDPKFLFISRKAPYGEGEIGLFVNIPSLVYILHHYKSEFSIRTQLEYDPNEESFQIRDPDSLFWSRVFRDHFLTGLVYGYGEKSAYLYEWSNKYLPSIGKEKRQFFSNNDDKMSQREKLRVKSEVLPSDLTIPTFFHFGVSDPRKLEYRIEREKIVDHFKDKDFTSEVMRILRGEE
ncbi:MAG: hypothetical protein KDK56_05575 [Simkania sp.]|nr:hypothetical protein [Simkania sp.]